VRRLNHSGSPLWWFYAVALWLALIIESRKPEAPSRLAVNVPGDVPTERIQGIANRIGDPRLFPVIHQLLHSYVLPLEPQPVISVVAHSEASAFKEFLQGRSAH